MNDYDSIAARYDFLVPENYRMVRAKGLFDQGSQTELFLTDLYWLSTEAIANYQPLPFQIKGLVPFACTARRDLFCWYPSWATERDVPVTFCPRDDENAACYASDFIAFLYRILLEEFSGSWLVESLGAKGTTERFRRYATDVGEFLPHDWAITLQELSNLPLTKLDEGVYGVMDRKKCNELIEAALSFPRLNKEFKHYVR